MVKSIKNKLILIILLLSVTLSLLIGIIGITKSSQVINDEAKDKLLFMVRSYVNQFDQILNNAETINLTVGNNIKANFDLSKLQKEPKGYIASNVQTFDKVIRGIIENQDNLLGMYICYNPDLSNEVDMIWYAHQGGHVIRKNTKNMYSIADFNSRAEKMNWYFSAIDTGRGVWTDPYIDINSNNLNLMTYTRPVYVGDTLIAVIGIDILFEKLKKK